MARIIHTVAHDTKQFESWLKIMAKKYGDKFHIISHSVTYDNRNQIYYSVLYSILTDFIHDHHNEEEQY